MRESYIDFILMGAGMPSHCIDGGSDLIVPKPSECFAKYVEAVRLI